MIARGTVMMLVAAGALFGDVSAGRRAYKNHDYTTAASEYRKSADAGDRIAQYYLGLLYRDGQGVPKDYGEAMKWLRKSADQGDSDAKEEVGYLYEKGYG